MLGANPLALTPEVDELRLQFERLSADASALVAPLSDEQFYWRAQPNTWSVAECLEHLNVTARFYLPALDAGIADAIRRGLYAPGPYRYNWIGRAAVALLEPPIRVRLKTPITFQPPSTRPRREIMAAFHAYKVQYVDRLRQASGIDLARARVSSPVAAWLKVPLGSAFFSMAAHERRHLAQARGVVEGGGQRSEVRGKRSEVRGQRLEVRG